MASPSQDERDRSVPEDVFLTNPVYHQIASRLLSTTPGVSLLEHIDVMHDVGRTISEGLTFWVHDVEAFRTATTTARDQSGQLACEIGQPSLHCAIGPGKCNVHIDEFAICVLNIPAVIPTAVVTPRR